MISIYCPSHTERLAYTLDLLLGDMLKTEYTLTDDKAGFLAASGPKINYSDTHFSECIHIKPCGLIFETSIKPVQPEIAEWQGKPCFFVTNKDSEISFDLFSAAFFMVSRYEEYTDKARDVHGRFAVAQSFAYKNDFLELPIINFWVDELRKLLNNKFSLNIEKMPFSFVSTIDVDQAFSFRHKGFKRTIAGLARDTLKLDLGHVFDRLSILAGKKQDPFDNFKEQEHLHAKYKIPVNYFFLLADYGRYDKNVPYTNPQFQRIINYCASFAPVGIHPSYQSYGNAEIIIKEKKRLEIISGQKVQQSRQHFLKFTLPETYRILIECGITDEYSMGFAGSVGFRAGIAFPFYWFDLEKNKKTGLKIFPFAVMDVTLKNYLKLNPETSFEKIKILAGNVKESGGVLMSLWHNESLSEYAGWQGWKKLYENMLAYNQPK